MANLLAYKQSFDWGNRAENRGVFIENLSSCINQALKFGDNIYKPPDLHDPSFPWGELLLFLANSCYDHTIFKEEFPWISQVQYQTLMAVSYVLHSTTPNESASIEDMDIEFPVDLNSLIGFEGNGVGRLVYNILSWQELHRSRVSTFSFDEQCKNYSYFKAFYKPYLKLDAGIIRKLIIKQSVNQFIKRLDAPKFNHDKYHVHFDDKAESALNIDGSWRHKTCKIPTQVRETLSSWGFLLPEECYTI